RWLRHRPAKRGWKSRARRTRNRCASGRTCRCCRGGRPRSRPRAGGSGGPPRKGAPGRRIGSRLPWRALTLDLLALDAGHDLFGERLGHFLIVGKVHGVGGGALGGRARLGGVAEQVAEPAPGADDLAAGAGLGVLDAAAAAVEIAGDCADVVLLVGDDDLDLHGGFEQGRLGALGGFLEGHGAGDLEGHFAGVHLVEGTVEERDLDIAHGIAGEHAAFERLFDALLDRLDELLGDGTADDVVLEDEPGTGRAGLDGDLDVAVLAAAAGLTDVLALGFGLRPNGFAVGDLGLADIGLDAEL